MFSPRNTLAITTLICTLGFLPHGQAAPSADPSFCTVALPGPIPMTYHRDLGTLHVPRDAPVGTVIGQLDPETWERTDGARLTCFHFGDGAYMRLHLNASVPIVPHPLPPIGGEPSDGHILETGIDGIGVRIRVKRPLDGVISSSFIPENGDTRVPYVAYRDTDNGLVGTILGLLYTQITFVKTGDIAPGPHRIAAKQMFNAVLDFNNFGEAFKFLVSATIVQAECSIVGDAVSPNPVVLGEWQKSDFTGPGSRTTTVPFTIALTGCVADPGGNSRVTLQLDPTNGSLADPRHPGVFSMGAGADADGVGIQVVKNDSSPFPLEVEHDMLPLSSGDMRLDLGAHLFQTEDTVIPGAASGALNFTLRYR